MPTQFTDTNVYATNITYTEVNNRIDIKADIQPIILKAITMNGSYSGVGSKLARENIERAIKCDISELSFTFGLSEFEQKRLSNWWMSFDTTQMKPLVKQLFGHKQPSLNALADTMLK